MFSIGDKVHYNEWDLIGVVEKVEGNFITVRFKEIPTPVGIERSALTIVEKTQNERELLRTRMQNLNNTTFSIDCEYEKIFTEESISLTRFVEKLNYYRNKWTKELNLYWVSNLLVKEGYLTTNEYGSKVPTEKGKLKGITRKKFYINRTESKYGNFYDLCAQEFLLKLILDNVK